MIRVQAAIGTLVLASFMTVPAHSVSLSAGEIENLGIEFAHPAPGHDAGGIEATASVVLPPAGDTVISARQPGLLTTITANVGDEVVAGQVLAEVSSPEFIRLQREFLDAVNAQRLARSEHERDAQLHAEGIISARRLQTTAMRKAVADAALSEHRQLLMFAGMLNADIRALERQQQLQASLAIRAPFGGVVAARLASTGERLDSMSPIYRLVDLSQLWLDINIPQEQLAGIQPGASVEATGSAGPANAAITTVGQAIDPSTQSAIARAQLDAGVAGFRPGQFVAVRVFPGKSDTSVAEAFRVPAAAVTRSANASYVFVRTAAGVDATQVDVISVAGPSAFIRGDVDADDWIAVSGVSVLKSMWLANAEPGS